MRQFTRYLRAALSRAVRLRDASPPDDPSSPSAQSDVQVILIELTGLGEAALSGLAASLMAAAVAAQDDAVRRLLHEAAREAYDAGVRLSEARVVRLAEQLTQIVVWRTADDDGPDSGG